jgi:hypothetical protein
MNSLPPELLGVWVGDEKMASVGSGHCARAIFQDSGLPGFKFVNWELNPGFCEEAGVDQITGSITGDWFGQILLDSVYTEMVMEWECTECEESNVFFNRDGTSAETFDDYEVQAKACGRFYVQNMNRGLEEYQCVEWQTSLLQRVEDESRRSLMSFGCLFGFECEDSSDNSSANDTLVVNTLTYGIPESSVLPSSAGCPAKVVFDKKDIDETPVVSGSVQLVLQQSYPNANLTTPSNWACYSEE